MQHAGIYILRRLLGAALVLVGISMITFIIVRVIPAEPAAIYLGPHPTEEQILQVRDELGLNQPLYVQYVKYLTDLTNGDWGESLRTHRPVLEEIMRFLPNSLELIFMAIILAGLVGIPLGVISAYNKGKIIDHLSRLVSIFGVSVPSFWVALVFQVLFFSLLGWFPIGGKLETEISLIYPIQQVTGFSLIDSLITGNWVAFKGLLWHLVLPVLTLSLYPLGLITRMTRSNMLEVLNQDYIKLSYANGLPVVRIIFKYALKNAISPTLTVMGLMFSYSLMGAFFVEVIFNWPGLGTYAVKSILGMDYPSIMGVTILIAFSYVLVNLITDLAQAFIDPRIQLGKEG